MTGGPPGQPVPFDRIADSYDESRGGPERGREIASVLAELLPATGTLLEIGVGTGLVSAALAERGRTVAGVDLSLPMLVRAAARTPGLVAVGDARRLPVATGSVAGAYLVHVLHVVGDVDATFAEAARVLGPGGVLVATARAAEPPARSDLADLLHGLQRRLDVAERPDREDLVVAAAAARGFRLVQRRTTDRSYLVLTPREVARRVEERSWSWMWSVAGPQTWRSEAGPLVERLRALPGQDDPRPSATEAPVLAFRRD